MVIPQDHQPGQIAVLIGNGDGTFQSAVEYSTGGNNPLEVAAGDFNADGKLDLAAGNANSSTVALLLGNGDGTFQSPVTFPSDTLDCPGGDSCGPLGLAVGDFNGDGQIDLAATVENSPYNLQLLLQGTWPAIAAVPPSVDFRQQNVGTSSAPSLVMLTNTGAATLTIKSIRITGPNSSDFAQTNNCSNSVPPNGICNISVTFTPTAPLARTAAVTITDNAANSLQTVSLSGTGVGSFVALSPPSLGFGNQTVGITSAPQVSTLTNTGNAALTITSIGLTGADSGDFAETNNCPTSVPPNGSCNISVTFTPSATGTRNAAVSITDNAPGSPQQLPLSGVGVLPAVTFSPASLAFPDQAVFTTSPALRVKLTNRGVGILLIRKIAATDPFGQKKQLPEQHRRRSKLHHQRQVPSHYQGRIPRHGQRD